MINCLNIPKDKSLYKRIKYNNNVIKLKSVKSKPMTLPEFNGHIQEQINILISEYNVNTELLILATLPFKSNSVFLNIEDLCLNTKYTNTTDVYNLYSYLESIPLLAETILLKVLMTYKVNCLSISSLGSVIKRYKHNYKKLNIKG